jgi:E3 Ubiquitin ligase
VSLPLPNEVMLLSAVAIAGGLYLFVRGFRLLARKRLLLNTPASKVRSASLGLVEIGGRATGPYTVPAPIIGNPCYLYRTTAWRQREESRSRDWKKVAEETLHVPFFLDDGTGTLLVNPEGAELDLHRDFCQKYDQTWLSRVPDRADSFLARHGISPGGDHFRIEEWTIQPQNPLFIVGTLAENRGFTARTFPLSNPDVIGNRALENRPVHPQPTEPAPEVVRLSGDSAPSPIAEMTQQQKLAAALTKAGIQKPEAWAAAGIAYDAAGVTPAPRVTQISVNEDLRANSMQKESDFNLSPPVLLMKGANNPAFLISWRSQNELVRSLAWKSVAMIWLGAGLTLLGMYVLLTQLELL